MTKPVPRLLWWPHPTNPLAITARWMGVLSNYTLEWGDNTPPTPMAVNSPPARHTYATAGSYTLTARPGLPNAVPVSVPVVVRPEMSPQATVEDLGGGTARLRLKGWAAPVLHRVSWGDGITEEFGPNQLVPVHTYPAGTDKPLIRVTDVPARRSITLIGPSAPPPEAPPPEFRILRHQNHDLKQIRVLFRPPTATDPYDHRAVAHSVDWGDDQQETVPAGTAYVDHNYAGTGSWPHNVPVPTLTVLDLATQAVATADAGELAAPFIWFDNASRSDLPGRWGINVDLLPPEPAWNKVWFGDWNAFNAEPPYKHTVMDLSERWHSAVLTTPEGTPVACAPVHSGDKTQGQAAYDWDLADPRLIRVTPFWFGDAGGGLARAFDITWGDGSPVERLAPYYAGTGHWYDRYGTYTLTVAATPNSSSSVRLGPCTVGTPRVDRLTRTVSISLTLQDSYHPVRIDWGDGTPVVREHPAAAAGGTTASVSHTYAEPGVYRVVVHAPMQDPVRHQVTIVAQQNQNPPLSVGFKVTTKWSGGYSGEFEVRNTTKTRVRGWRIEFTLGAPAELADVWPGSSVRLYRLAADRYALTSTAPLGVGTSAKPGVRIEPCGSTRVLPTAISAIGLFPTTDGDGGEPILDGEGGFDD